MKKMPWQEQWIPGRADVARAALLVIMTVLLWCAVENRWTAANWAVPVDYLTDPEKGDVIGALAGIRAARDGHFLPFQFTNIPELGAPGVANWDDFPTTEKPLFVLAGLLANFTGIFEAANLVVLLGHVLAALAFYAACRLLGASWIWSFAGAMTFALNRYEFSHSLHHLAVSYVWHLPLLLVASEWLLRGEGVRVGTGRFYFALAVAFVTGVQNVYYTWMFLQFVALAGLYQMWRGGWPRALAPAAVIGMTIAAFVLMNANTFAYHLAYGPNAIAVVRDYHWLEVYGLKLVDLVVPPPDHAFAPFAAWGAAHAKEVMLPLGEMPPSGYLGLLGLAATAWLVAVSVRAAANRLALPLEALLILWIILYAMVGGLNGVLGVLGFQLFRATTRYSIFILCLVLMYAVRQLSAVKFRETWLPYVLGAAVIFVAWLDQTPQVSDAELAELTAQVNADRQFATSMESALPAGARVLQLPLMDFPECPAPGVGSYDHFRPYLYTHGLRFSFGTDKGRPAAEWQHQLSMTSLPAFVAQLQDQGFGAIYVNRDAFQDKGAGLVNALKAGGLTDIIESSRGDVFCVILKKP